MREDDLIKGYEFAMLPSKKLEAVITWSRYIGISGSIAIATIGIFLVNSVGVNLDLVARLNQILLVWGFVHMLLLSFLTRSALNFQLKVARVKAVDSEADAAVGLDEMVSHVELGGLLAMTGYIHTLIGTFASLGSAMGFAGQGAALRPQDLATIIYGIGLSLLTSIIGWWFGKEFQRGKWFPGNAVYFDSDVGHSVEALCKSMDNAGEVLGASVGVFRRDLSECASTLNDAFVELGGRLSKSVRDSGSELNYVAEDFRDRVRISLAEPTGDLKNLFSKINEDIAAISSKAAMSAVDTGNNLDRISKTMGDLDDVFGRYRGRMEVLGGNLEEKIEQSSSGIDVFWGSVKSVQKNVDELGGVVAGIVDRLGELAKTLDALDRLVDHLDRVNESKLGE